MKTLELDFPKIKIDIAVLAKLEAYANNMNKRGLILCDCKIDTKTTDITIIDCFLVSQTWDYSKNAQKYEEINEYVGYTQDKSGDFIFTQCFVRVELSKNSSIVDGDFKYFESLCDVTDFLIVGDITQETKDKPSTLTLYYLDLEHRVAMSYCSPYSDRSGYDRAWEFSFGPVSNDEIKEEIKEFCKDKTYGTYGTYGGYGNYNNQSYQKTLSEAENVKVEKSELNKTDPEISSLVSVEGKS